MEEDLPCAIVKLQEKVELKANCQQLELEVDSNLLQV